MAGLTTAQAALVNNMCPSANSVALGTVINSLITELSTSLVCKVVADRISITAAMNSDNTYEWDSGLTNVYFALVLWGDAGTFDGAANLVSFTESAGVLSIAEGGAWADTADEFMMIAIGN
jgi:hypothetical protein